jgi:hypothetical protein
VPEVDLRGTGPDNFESVIVTDGCAEGYNETKIRNTQLHNSFFCGRGRIAQPESSKSSICVVVRE